jgi:hypothetical protein
MSYSADYYFVFWSGSADYYFVWNVWRGWGEPTQTKEQTLLSTLYTLCYTRYYYAICGWHTLPCVSSEQIIHKNARKYSFSKHWKHLLVGAEVRVAQTSTCQNNLSFVITSCSTA